MIKSFFRKPIVRKVLIALIPIFLLMQFYRIDKTNPAIDPAQGFMTLEQPPTHITTMIKNACYDCHSHETEYPWYTNVMPFSKWIQGHTLEGRKHLNFSTWATYPQEEKNHMLKECGEVLIETRMPMTSYLLAHSEARITKEQRQELANWFDSKRK